MISSCSHQGRLLQMRSMDNELQWSCMLIIVAWLIVGLMIASAMYLEPCTVSEDQDPKIAQKQLEELVTDTVSSMASYDSMVDQIDALASEDPIRNREMIDSLNVQSFAIKVRIQRSLRSIPRTIWPKGAERFDP